MAIAGNRRNQDQRMVTILAYKQTSLARCDTELGKYFTAS